MSFPANGHIHPGQIYICTKQEIEEFIDRSGSWIMYSGHMYDIQTKKVFGNRYEVTFKRRSYK